MLKHLLQKRADLIAEAQTVFDLSATENRSLTEAEEKRDDAISAELKGLDGQIERAQNQAERQRKMGGQIDPNDLNRGPQNPNGSFASFGEQLFAVARAGMQSGAVVDPRLIQAVGTGANEGVAADGGFLVQTDLIGDLLKNTYELGEVSSRVYKIGVGPMSNGIKINGIDETSRVNGSRWGGIQAYWTGEAQLMTASQPKFKRIGLELDKLTGMCYATDELLQDSTALESWISTAFPQEFSFKLEDAIFNGTGAGMPLGFMNSSALITVSKEASQPTLTIFPENIVKMWSRMPSRSRKNCVWLINQDVEPQLYLLNLKVKNVAGTENVGGIAIPPVIYTPPGFNGNQYATLMGRPVIPVEYCASLTTAGDIVLVDLSQYLMIDKGGINQASSIHVRFLYNETAFRFTYRANGQPIWQTALTPYKGSTTQSPFVALQSR